MATAKKLRIEVELDTTKAKRQAAEIGGGANGASVSTESPASDRASRQVRSLGEAAQSTGVSMRAAGKAFAGMAVGLATSYAAGRMRPGGARNAVEYGSAAITGAAAGMMFGPLGAAIGGLAGVLKTYVEKEETRRQAEADFMRGEHDYRSAREFRQLLDNLTEVGDHFENLKKNIEETRRQLEHYRQVEQDLIAKTKQFRANGNEENAKLEEGYLAQNRSRQERLEAVLKGLEKTQKTQKTQDAKGDPREGTGATDALAKVGGTAYLAAAKTAETSADALSRAGAFSFGFSVASQKAASMSFGGPSRETDADRAIRTATERSAKLDEEIAQTLKEIAQNTKGGLTWQ